VWWTEHGYGDAVVWTPAQWLKTDGEIAVLPGGWNGLARVGKDEVVAGTQGNPPSDVSFLFVQPKSSFHPILKSQISGGQLVFHAVTFTNSSDGELEVESSDLPDMNMVTLASCEAHPNRVYAVTFADPPDGSTNSSLAARGRVNYLLRSDDAGETWYPMLGILAGPLHAPGFDVSYFSHGVDAGGRIKNVSVHPTIPDIVGFSAYVSFVSEDGGATTWTPVGGTWIKPNSAGWYTAWTYSVDPTTGNPLMRADHHTLLFAPDATTPDRIFLATDGGVFRMENWHDPSTTSSIHNAGLRTLQFYCPTGSRESQGSVGSTPFSRGLAAGGLQDKGNIWKPDNIRGVWGTAILPLRWSISKVFEIAISRRELTEAVLPHLLRRVPPTNCRSAVSLGEKRMGRVVVSFLNCARSVRLVSAALGHL
jgi:hypothetical protein